MNDIAKALAYMLDQLHGKFPSAYLAEACEDFLRQHGPTLAALVADGGDTVPRSRWESAERDLVAMQAEMDKRSRRYREVAGALLDAVEKSKKALQSGQVGHIDDDTAVYHLDGNVCSYALNACRDALAVMALSPASKNSDGGA